VKAKQRYTKRLYVRCSTRVYERIKSYCKEHHCTYSQALDELLDVVEVETIIEVSADSHARHGQRGAGMVATHNTVKQLMDSNNRIAQQFPGQRRDELVYITKTLVRRLSRADFESISPYWEEHGSEILRHNYAMGFQDAADGRGHNRRAAAIHAKQWAYQS